MDWLPLRRVGYQAVFITLISSHVLRGFLHHDKGRGHFRAVLARAHQGFTGREYSSLAAQEGRFLSSVTAVFSKAVAALAFEAEGRLGLEPLREQVATGRHLAGTTTKTIDQLRQSGRGPSARDAGCPCLDATRTWGEGRG